MDEAADGRVIEEGKKVKIRYTLTVDGEVVDETGDREPFEYVQGKHQIIPGLETRLIGLKIGDQQEIIVGPDDAYGVEDPKAYIEISKSKLPEGEIQLGMLLHATGPDGRQMLVRISEIREETVLLNFNHPLAGKELHFFIEVLEIL